MNSARSPNTTSFSRMAVITLFLVLVVMRIFSLTPNELSWDVFGYYLYLPATFIHHDPFLHDITWIHELIRARPVITGTLYQLSTAPDNSTPMYFFLMGTALCYLPFFLLGHGIAWITGAPMDGFSSPYQITLAVGCLLYALIGLFYLRKVLLRFFSDGVTAATLAVIVLGTNYLHFATAKNLETAGFLFCWMTVLVWNTMRWHEDQRRRNLLMIAFSIAMITLIKPSEIVCGLIPLLWGVTGRATFLGKLRLIRKHWKDLGLAILLGLLVLGPQLLYWRLMTGHFIYDSYKNFGVGLDLSRPHILNVLFSFRKGWLIYTPVMLFALAGFIPFHRRSREAFWAVVVYCIVSFYILASWSEWWYGASYSIRPMITLYPVLAIPLGHAFAYIVERRTVARLLGIGMVVVLLLWNGFQLWQFRHWVLHPYLTTKAYYWAVFGRTSVPPGAEKLLSFDHSFDGSDRMEDLSHYERRPVGSYGFESEEGTGALMVMDTLIHSHVVLLDSIYPYSPNIEVPYEQIASTDHIWVKARVRILVPVGYKEEAPCLVFSMQRDEGPYGYKAFCDTVAVAATGIWTTLEGEYLTPPIRDIRDRLKVYVWHRGKQPIRIDDLSVEAFIPR